MHADGNSVTGREAIPTAKGLDSFIGCPGSYPMKWENTTGITAQSSQWFPHPDETGPLSLIGKDLNSVQKSDDWNPTAASTYA
jgi:hypothetical protein